MSTSNINSFSYLPELDRQANCRGAEHHPAGVIIQKVQQRHCLAETVDEDGANGQPCQVFGLFPEFYVILECLVIFDRQYLCIQCERKLKNGP